MIRALPWIAAAGAAGLAGALMYGAGLDEAFGGDDDRPALVEMSDEDRDTNIAEAEAAARLGTERVRLIVDEALTPPDPLFASEFDALVPLVEAGELTREEAVMRALDKAAGAVREAPAPALDPAMRTRLIADGDAALEKAHADVDALYDGGAIERSVHDRLYNQIMAAQRRLDAVRQDDDEG